MLLGAWRLFLIVFHVDPFVGKTPLDVWHFLTATLDRGRAAERTDARATSTRRR